jgi:hypothetical protein|tara:strand:- start:151 stop:1059 length:909 start_codon:yes stop_codon:yes gene_type:complete
MSEEAVKNEEIVEEGEIVELEDSVESTDAPEEQTELVQSKDNNNVESEVESDKEELQDYSDKVQKRINTLTRKLREAERGQDSALQYAQSLQQKVSRLETSVNTVQQNSLSESETRLEAQKAQAMASLQKAHEVADYEKVAQAQDVLAKLAVQEQKVQEGKLNIARQKNLVNQNVQNYVQPQVQQQSTFSPKMQEWIDNGNGWFLNNPVMHESGVQIHQELEDEGFVIESDEYFTEVNKRIKAKHPDYFGESAQSKPSQKVASAGRVSGNSGKKQIKLSPSEVQMAKKLNVPLKEYAKYVKR